MDKIKEIYERIKSDLEELKLIAINNMYDDYFAKSKRSKYIIDSSISKEIGIRKIVGDNYYYAMLEDNIMLLLDNYISNNNSTNIKVPVYCGHRNSPIIIPNREYKRVSRVDMHRLSKKYLDGDYKRLDVFDDNFKIDIDDLISDDYEEPLLDNNVEKILNIISKLNKCNYLGFFSLANGDFHELYEYNELVLFDFTANLDIDKLNVTCLEMSGDLSEIKNIK